MEKKIKEAWVDHKERKKSYRKQRKEKRNARYREAIGIMNRDNVRLRVAIRRIDNPFYEWHQPWEDSNSSTGWTHNCCYWDTCEHPCNGDC